MLKAVFRPTELVPLPDKVVIESPTSYPDLAHLAPIEALVTEEVEIEQYRGPTADDLRREAEMFKSHWEEEKERMFSSARAEAENIIQDAQKAAFAEVKRQTDEAQVIKQQAEEEAERIIAEAKEKASDIEFEMKQSIDSERKTVLDEGRESGRVEGFADGRSEVDRLIERTQVVLERAQDKRAEILGETEKQIVDLVLLISRKVIKVISENQRNVIITNVIEALRKVKSKGDIIIRVNLADLKLATEHKQDFIRLMENAKSLNIIEDSSVDLGGCIIETDFGEIDARIASQLTELENKILEISPIKSLTKDNIPPPVIRTANLNIEMAAASLMAATSNDTSVKNEALNDAASFSAKSMDSNMETYDEDTEDLDPDEVDIPQAANAALTASAALAALATMATKGRREIDKKIISKMEGGNKRKTDNPFT